MEHKKPYISDKLREHFYSGRENRSEESEKGEGKLYDTTMTRFLEYLNNRVKSVQEGKQEKFEKLIENITIATFRYIDTRRQMALASQRLRGGYGTASAERQNLTDKDRARRSAHEALMDSLNIATRNIVKESSQDGAIPNEFTDILDKNSPDYRDKIAQFAIDYAWQKLDKEEHGKLYKKNKQGG